MTPQNPKTPNEIFLFINQKMMKTICMYFYQSTEVTYLFKNLKIDTTGIYILFLLITFVLAFFTEYLASLRQILIFHARNEMKTLSNSDLARQKSTKLRFKLFFIQLIRVTLSFMLMLLCMTFNIGLCLAVILGLTTAYGFVSLSNVEPLPILNKVAPSEI